LEYLEEKLIETTDITLQNEKFCLNFENLLNTKLDQIFAQ